MEEFTSGFTDTQAAVTALIGFTPDLSYCLALTKTSFHAPAPMKFTGLSGGVSVHIKRREVLSGRELLHLLG